MQEFYFGVTEADTNLNKFFYCHTENTGFITLNLHVPFQIC